MVYGKYFRRSRAANSVVSGQIWAKFVNFIKIGKLASEIFKFKSVIFRHSRASNSKMSGLIRPKIELDGAFMPVLVTSNFAGDSIKNERASMETIISQCRKTLCSLFLPPVMLHIKFDQNWPTGLRDIQVQKCKIFIIQGQVTPKLVI